MDLSGIMLAGCRHRWRGNGSTCGSFFAKSLAIPNVMSLEKFNVLEYGTAIEGMVSVADDARLRLCEVRFRRSTFDFETICIIEGGHGIVVVWFGDCSEIGNVGGQSLDGNGDGVGMMDTASTVGRTHGSGK